MTHALSHFAACARSRRKQRKTNRVSKVEAALDELATVDSERAQRCDALFDGFMPLRLVRLYRSLRGTRQVFSFYVSSVYVKVFILFAVCGTLVHVARYLEVSVTAAPSSELFSALLYTVTPLPTSSPSTMTRSSTYATSRSVCTFRSLQTPAGNASGAKWQVRTFLLVSSEKLQNVNKT